MSVLSWGKCVIRYAKSVDGAPSGDWTAFEVPKLDSTTLSTSAGDETLAQEEGGGIVDAKYTSNTYEFTFDLFEKKGKAQPFADSDGTVAGEWALQVVPEDPTCVGLQIDRCVIRKELNFTSADGITYHYVVKCLKPAAGQTVKVQQIEDKRKPGGGTPGGTPTVGS